MLENKEARQRTYAMFTAKFITLQEVQKTVTRSHYLWTVRVRRLSFLSSPLPSFVLCSVAPSARGAGAVPEGKLLYSAPAPNRPHAPLTFVCLLSLLFV